MKPIALFWHRRDLRLFDNAGLHAALQSGLPVLPLFIFDTNILDQLSARDDARVGFIHQSLATIKEELEKKGSSLLVKHGDPVAIWQDIIATYPIAAVFTNHDYEPYAKKRDEAVKRVLAEKGIPLHTFKDHVIFEEQEIVKKDGTPYTVFTPYKRRWLEKFEAEIGESSFPAEDFQTRYFETAPFPMPSLSAIGFQPSEIDIPSATVSRGLIRDYGTTRDFPAVDGTSRLGIHFRFGTISIRQKARHASQLSTTYLNELIWRDFYAMILANFPHVATEPFRPEYDTIAWVNNTEDFRKWCTGKTGYPIVDAGMRELNTTGYMHNRVRMITASFLAKHLLIDWRMGEAYFAEKLLDFDLASNNGGWQWAAGCGTDAAPYFRIFNPTAQQQKFDKDFTYIKKWVPEFDTPSYPPPMVDHKFARERCLNTYKEALAKK